MVFVVQRYRVFVWRCTNPPIVIVHSLVCRYHPLTVLRPEFLNDVHVEFLDVTILKFLVPELRRRVVEFSVTMGSMRKHIKDWDTAAELGRGCLWDYCWFRWLLATLRNLGDWNTIFWSAVLVAFGCRFGYEPPPNGEFRNKNMKPFCNDPVSTTDCP